MLTANRQVIDARWPELGQWLVSAPAVPTTRVPGAPHPTLVVHGIQLAGAFAPRDEAALQARLVPETATHPTCYGIGQGELPRTLIARQAVEELTVVLFHPAVTAAVLAHHDCSDWLGDPRVSLVRGRDRNEIATPFAAAPADLRLAEDAAVRLRDLVLLELATPHIRRHLQAAHEEFTARFAENRDLFASDGDVAELFGTAAGAAVHVAAAGPTLADHLDDLGRRGDQLLLAVDAALPTLAGAGVRPDVVVSMDPHPQGPEVLLNVPQSAIEGTVLVYDPVVRRQALEGWPGRRLVMYRDGDLHASLRRDQPKGVLWSSGSVLHPAVALAVEMGANRVTLYGADFAHVGGRTHAAGYPWQLKKTAGPAAGSWVESGEGERLATQPNLLGYLRDLERFLARHPEVRWINASRRGARIAGTSYPEDVDG